jgi:hypothetical protein
VVGPDDVIGSTEQGENVPLDHPVVTYDSTAGLRATGDLIPGLSVAQLATNATAAGPDSASFVRILAAPMGFYQVTGGTINTQQVLYQIDLPDGCLLDYHAGLRIQAAFWCSENTNSKRYGVWIGTDMASSAVTLYDRTRNVSTVGGDSCCLVVKRHPTVSTRLKLFGNVGIQYFGQLNVNVAMNPVADVLCDPATTSLKLFFVGNKITANTDQVTFTNGIVTLFRADA